MIIDVYVTRDHKAARATFERQSDRDTHYRIKAPADGVLIGAESLFLKGGNALSAFDVLVYAKVQSFGFDVVGWPNGVRHLQREQVLQDQ